VKNRSYFLKGAQRRQFHFSNNTGLSYMEVMLAVFLLMLIIIPLMRSLEWGINTQKVVHKQQDVVWHAQTKLSEVRAEKMTVLLASANTAGAYTTASSYSDAPATENRRLVYVWYYDIDNADADNNPYTIFDANTDSDSNPFTGADVVMDLVWIKVVVENTSIELVTLHATP
jgi:type II secretory pathway pseudopilin PulG